MHRALLIDDEAHSRAYLRAMLAAHPDVEIVGEAAALKPARALIARGNYDFVFLDVKLGADTGFELVPDLPPDKPIIFVTGYEHHARHAFEVNALDYLVKPVRASRLAESLQRLNHSPRRDPLPAPPPPAPKILSPDEMVTLNSGSRALFTRVADICLIAAQENYSFVHLVDGTQVMVRRSLKSWADSLPPGDFVRVHRTALVNLARVMGYEPESARNIALRVTGVPLPVRVSRFATPEVKARLQARFPDR